MTETASRDGPGPADETAIVVTLDELRPYENDPRVRRNPAYGQIKASIRERGLDAAPAITRRPGESHYIIRNGGNTRLAILRELWAETRDERFFRISCRFRPWPPERGEIVALTGHLAENELRGGLTFIERALGVQKAQELYEAEGGGRLSQSELARRLAADGYPVAQSHISRMREAVRYLLPALPRVLYGGLGRHQVERLAVLRRACERAWQQHAAMQPPVEDFAALFHEVLATFDDEPESFSVERVQDELVGQMAGLLRVEYDVLNLEVVDGAHRHRVLASPPGAAFPPSAAEQGSVAIPAAPEQPAEPPDRGQDVQPGGFLLSGFPAVARVGTERSGDSRRDGNEQTANTAADTGDSPPRETTCNPDGGLRAAGDVAAAHGAVQPSDVQADVFDAVPAQGMYPVADIWFIAPALDEPGPLRSRIARLAREIAAEAGVDGAVSDSGQGVGFVCMPPDGEAPGMPSGPAVAGLLQALSHLEGKPPPVADLGLLLHGRGATMGRLSDASLIRLFRLLRLARRLWELEQAAGSSPGLPPKPVSSM